MEYFASATARSNGTVGKTVNFAYNSLGLLSHYDDGTTSGDYTYDVLGRLETVTVNYGPFTKSHSYTYDVDGRRKTYTNPEGITYTYSYTENGSFQSLLIPNEGTIAVTAYKWRHPSEWLFPGGARIAALADGLLRPQDVSLLDPGSNVRANRVYTYNAENHITGIATENGAHTYTLDELYRLTVAAFEANTQLENEAYTYDGVGNRLTDNGNGPWVYNANHELQSIPSPSTGEGETTYIYDANGHTVSKTIGTAVTTYEYDLAERMSAVKQDGVTLGQYVYDPFGRRIKKVTAAGTRYFHYDDTGLLAEYDAAGALIHEYQYKPGSTWMTHPLFKRDANGKVHYYYNSHLGQPLKLFDRGGKITWEGRSQAFGETAVLIEETENNLRFPGQYEDQETGLYYNYHRYYDPETGRYLQADPIGLAGGANFYAYAGGMPLWAVDPMGEAWHIFAGAIIGGISGLIGALNSPCATPEDLLWGALVGAGIGAAVAAAPQLLGMAAGGVGAASMMGAVTGFSANSLAQVMTGGLSSYSFSQALTQGALGAFSGGLGNVVAFNRALLAVKSGNSARQSIKIGDAFGSFYSASVSATANLALPKSLGGVAPNKGIGSQAGSSGGCEGNCKK